MRLLLDTHAVLWALSDSPRLSGTARRVLMSDTSEVFVSPVSAYELAFKAALGKLPPLPRPFAELCADQAFTELPVTSRQADLAARLPLVHRDPWDRILAAQAILEGLTLLTQDPALAALGPATLW